MGGRSLASSLGMDYLIDLEQKSLD